MIDFAVVAWFWNTIPYILALATLLLAFTTLFKEWTEYKNSRLRLAALLGLVVVASLTFVSLYRDAQQKAEDKAQKAKDKAQAQADIDVLRRDAIESNKTLTDLQQKADTANSNFTTQLEISDRVTRELGILRHELELERTPVTKATVEWLVAIPAWSPCLQSSVEDVEKQANVGHGLKKIRHDISRLSKNCEQELGGLFRSISLNLVFCKPCKKTLNPFSPSARMFDAPQGGLQNVRWVGGVPEGYWLLSVSENALDPPDRPMVFDERTRLIYIQFETIIRESELRTPTGRHLSIGDFSGGIFAFEISLDGYPVNSPPITPELRSVNLELNGWRFGFAQASRVKDHHSEIPFSKIFMSPSGSPTYRYIGQAPILADTW